MKKNKRQFYKAESYYRTKINVTVFVQSELFPVYTIFIHSPHIFKSYYVTSTVKDPSDAIMNKTNQILPLMQITTWE